MGEVYRATDTKLGREVALKILPAGLAADPDRRARFEREAKLLASLNHPGIAHLYGFEAARLADGSTAHVLAMELVEGEDLAATGEVGVAVDQAGQQGHVAEVVGHRLARAASVHGDDQAVLDADHTLLEQAPGLDVERAPGGDGDGRGRLGCSDQGENDERSSMA
jgi:hypothetical protein